VLATWAHGKGFATEAVRAACEWVHAHLDAVGHTVCMVAPQNAASIRVAIKCGFVPDGHATHKGSDVDVFRRTRLP